MTQELLGKRILLIALSRYPDGIIKRMKDMGAEVDYFNDKPNDGFWCKTLGRLQSVVYNKVITNYYYSEIEKRKSRTYDYILILRGEYTTEDALVRLKSTFKDSKLILYIWDGLHKFNTRGIENKWKYFDKVYTFDRIDYEDNKNALNFLPLYYYDDLIPQENCEIDKGNYKYDISFIGTGHADRVRIVKDIMKQYEEKGKKVFCYIYMPHPMVYYFNKLTNKDFKGIKKQDIQFKPLPFSELYNIYSQSECVVDVENPEQHGLTMRTIEILGLKKKLITTNRDIVNYDFYNSNNILLINRTNPKADVKFLEQKYELLPNEIYVKYSLSNWLLEVLK